VVKRVNHVGIVVKSIEETMKTYSELFGIKPARIEDVPDQGVKSAMVSIGDTAIELIEPTDPSGGVAKFLERGGGLHHISLEVEDIDAELKSLAGKGARLIDKEARSSYTGKIAFVHPAATKGILVELAQKG
jgi:methylmalonyl-CoA epimerase